MTSTDAILVAKTNALFRDAAGNKIRLRKGQTVEKGHPITRGREHLFEPFKVTYPSPAKPKAAAKKSPAKPAGKAK